MVSKEDQPIRVEVRCKTCGRILCYKMSAASGLVELKCQKCGRTAVVNLSLRRAKGKLDYRTAKDIGTYIWRATALQSGRYAAGGPASPAIRGNPDAGTDRLFQRGSGLCKGVPPASQSGPVPFAGAAAACRFRPELAGLQKTDRGRAGTGGRRCRADGGGICCL